MFPWITSLRKIASGLVNNAFVASEALILWDCMESYLSTSCSPIIIIVIAVIIFIYALYFLEINASCLELFCTNLSALD